MGMMGSEVPGVLQELRNVYLVFDICLLAQKYKGICTYFSYLLFHAKATYPEIHLNSAFLPFPCNFQLSLCPLR